VTSSSASAGHQHRNASPHRDPRGIRPPPRPRPQPDQEPATPQEHQGLNPYGPPRDGVCGLSDAEGVAAEGSALEPEDEYERPGSVELGRRTCSVAEHVRRPSRRASNVLSTAIDEHLRTRLTFDPLAATNISTATDEHSRARLVFVLVRRDEHDRRASPRSSDVFSTVLDEHVRAGLMFVRASRDEDARRPSPRAIDVYSPAIGRHVRARNMFARAS